MPGNGAVVDGFVGIYRFRVVLLDNHPYTSANCFKLSRTSMAA